MKKFYFLLIALCFFQNLQAQIINFSNITLKQWLLQADPLYVQRAKDLNGNFVKIDANSNNEIEVAEALNISYLNLSMTEIINIEGIQYFTNLENLLFGNNQIASVGTVLDALVNLKHISCPNTLISNINLEPHPILESLTANGLTNLTTIDLSGSHNLKYLYLDHCVNLTSVDVSMCHNMTEMWVDYCPNLQTLNIKNGVDEVCTFGYCNSLHYICCDEIELSDVTFRAAYDAASDCDVNSYCTLNPGGRFFAINGNAIFDIESNGCGLTDPFYPLIKFNLTGGSTTFNTFFGDENGRYAIGVGAGNYTLTPVLENSTFFTISPSSTIVSFPTTSSPANRNFCIRPNGTHPDLEIIILPVNVARPGFNSSYKIIYKNNGNQVQSGNVNIAFNNNILNLVTSNPTPSIQNTSFLAWNFSNLLPLDYKEILLTLNLNSPTEIPAVNGGDILNFTATVTGLPDETPADNISTIQQTVLNSFDPNDKRCLEGTTISTTKIGEYVHYMIRFENTGTFPAENVIVVDDINTIEFSIATLIPLSGSHPFTTRIKGNKVEFVFENINLPIDDANNDGYVAFKIKTKRTLVAGDTFSNSASIYFDYNNPIITNTATTTITALSNPDFEFNKHFVLTPNPVEDVFNIQKSSGVVVTSMNIYNVLGQLVLTVAEPKSAIDVSNLKSGSYYVKILSTSGSSSAKFIKK